MDCDQGWQRQEREEPVPGAGFAHAELLPKFLLLLKFSARLEEGEGRKAAEGLVSNG